MFSRLWYVLYVIITVDMAMKFYGIYIKIKLSSHLASVAHIEVGGCGLLLLLVLGPLDQVGDSRHPGVGALHPPALGLGGHRVTGSGLGVRLCLSLAHHQPRHMACAPVRVV